MNEQAKDLAKLFNAKPKEKKMKRSRRIIAVVHRLKNNQLVLEAMVQDLLSEVYSLNMKLKSKTVEAENLRLQVKTFFKVDVRA